MSGRTLFKNTPNLPKFQFAEIPRFNSRTVAATTDAIDPVAKPRNLRTEDAPPARNAQTHAKTALKYAVPVGSLIGLEVWLRGKNAEEMSADKNSMPSFKVNIFQSSRHPKQVTIQPAQRVGADLCGCNFILYGTTTNPKLPDYSEWRVVQGSGNQMVLASVDDPNKQWKLQSNGTGFAQCNTTPELQRPCSKGLLGGIGSSATGFFTGFIDFVKDLPATLMSLLWLLAGLVLAVFGLWGMWLVISWVLRSNRQSRSGTRRT